MLLKFSKQKLKITIYEILEYLNILRFEMASSSITEITPINYCQFLKKAIALANVSICRKEPLSFLLTINKEDMSVADIFVKVSGVELTIDEFKPQVKECNKTYEYFKWIRDNKTIQLNESLMRLVPTIKPEDQGYNQFLFFLSMVLANFFCHFKQNIKQIKHRKHIKRITPIKHQKRSSLVPIADIKSEPINLTRNEPAAGEFQLLDGVLQFDDMSLYLFPQMYVNKFREAANTTYNLYERGLMEECEENLHLETELIVNKDTKNNIVLKGSLTNISSETTCIIKHFIPTRGFNLDIHDEKGERLSSYICTKLAQGPCAENLLPGEKFEFESHLWNYHFKKQTMYYITVSYARFSAVSNKTMGTLFLSNCEPKLNRSSANLKDLSQCLSYKFI